jgi:hypothetical protein
MEGQPVINYEKIRDEIATLVQPVCEARGFELHNSKLTTFDERTSAAVNILTSSDSADKLEDATGFRLNITAVVQVFTWLDADTDGYATQVKNDQMCEALARVLVGQYKALPNRAARMFDYTGSDDIKRPDDAERIMILRSLKFDCEVIMTQETMEQ